VVNFSTRAVLFNTPAEKNGRIIIGSDRRPETKQRIEGKLVRFRPGRFKDRVRVRDN